MTAATFQSGLARLVCDAEFAAAVAREGAEVLPADLNAVERRRLLAVAADPGLTITRTLHRGFRLSKLLHLLPLTFTLLDQESGRRETAGFWKARPSMGFYFLEEAVAFCDYLLGRLADGGSPQRLARPGGGAFLGEIIAYERAALELQRARPVAAPVTLEKVFFDHDPLPLIAAVGEGRIPSHGEIEARPCCLVGRRRGAEAAGESPGGEGEVEWSLIDTAEAATPN